MLPRLTIVVYIFTVCFALDRFTVIFTDYGSDSRQLRRGNNILYMFYHQLIIVSSVYQLIWANFSAWVPRLCRLAPTGSAFWRERNHYPAGILISPAPCSKQKMDSSLPEHECKVIQGRLSTKSAVHSLHTQQLHHQWRYHGMLSLGRTKAHTLPPFCYVSHQDKLSVWWFDISIALFIWWQK